MTNSLRFSLPGKKESISTVRVAISTYAESFGFSKEAVDDISISILEGIKVVCCHGYELRASRFIVICDIMDDALQIKISNSNATFTVDKGECELCGHCPGDGDLSIFILSSLMDEVDLDQQADGYKSLFMKKIKNGEKE